MLKKHKTLEIRYDDWYRFRSLQLCHFSLNIEHRRACSFRPVLGFCFRKLTAFGTRFASPRWLSPMFFFLLPLLRWSCQQLRKLQSITVRHMIKLNFRTSQGTQYHFNKCELIYHKRPQRTVSFSSSFVCPESFCLHPVHLSFSLGFFL